MFKRQRGSEWSVNLDGRKFSPKELSSLVLRSLKTDAEALFGETVKRAVITVPAYFNDRQRKSTLHAGRIAGLQVEHVFNEFWSRNSFSSARRPSAGCRGRRTP